MRIILFLGLFLVFNPPVFGADVSVDPKIAKGVSHQEIFQFALKYVEALKYLNASLERQSAETPLSADYLDNIDMLQTMVKNRFMDNTNIRVAQKTLKPFLNSNNIYARKISDVFISASNSAIKVNFQERMLLNGLLAGTVKPEQFTFEYNLLSSPRKEATSQWIESSVLLKKLLTGEALDPGQKKLRLMITSQERENLISAIDDFYSGNFDLKMKVGHSYIDACVANLREVLENDSLAAVTL